MHVFKLQVEMIELPFGSFALSETSPLHKFLAIILCRKAKNTVHTDSMPA
jgi:hypothetical protein